MGTMSLMTQSLLLQAQSLRLEGESDASIDLLRIVLSQCDADLRSVHHTDDDDNSDDCSHPQRQHIMDTTRQINQMGSYQLALLLLQRSGRPNLHPDGSSRTNDNNASADRTGTSKKDVHEAD